MVASAALVSLLQILDSLLQSSDRGYRISFNTAQLKSLQDKVSFLLEFLKNSSPNYGECEDLEEKIMLAAYKVEDAIVSAISNQLIAEPEIVEQSDGIAHPHFLLNLLAPPLARVKENAQILNSVMCVLPISLQFILNLCFQIVIFFPFCTLLYLSYFTMLIVNPIASVAIYAVHKAAVRGISFATIYWRCVYQRRIRDLDVAMIDFDFIMEEVIEIRDASGSGQDRESLQSADSAISSSIGIGRNVVVGLESLDIVLIEIRDRLTRDSSGLEIVSIVGMGGIGKTTLARQVHDHPSIVERFDVRSWVTVSQEYSLPRIMLDLLASANLSDSANIQTEEILKIHKEKQLKNLIDDDDLDERLGDHLYKNLMGRRYLIVMDDVWDIKILDFVTRFFPGNKNGSRVLLTTRLSLVASYANPSSPPLQMQLLSDDDSWHLFCKKAFGGEGCPRELEAIGKKIARNCRGLPLAIVVVAGLLYNEHITEEHITEGKWEKVLSLNSRSYKEQCLEILGLSYNNLPHHLKPCFLYMGAFLGAMDIHTTTLFNVWAAEGLLMPSTSKSSEEVAEENLKDLIQRNLILIGKQSRNGNIKTCRIHDLLRDFCLLNAKKENFLGFASRNGKKISHSSGSRPARVLELYIGDEFPDELLTSVYLRYLGLNYKHWPSPISRLWSLQTLVFHHHMIPAEIWLLPNLRHLYLKRSQLPDPPDCQLLCNTILENLQTLVGVSCFKLTEGVLKRIPNMKKLSISYEFRDLPEYYFESLANLSGLHQLETLKIAVIVKSNVSTPVVVHSLKLAFPEKLKELSLSGCSFPWGNMRTIGALPNLQVLKLKNNAFVGEKWEVVEGEFPELKFLVIDATDLEHWIADETPFPHLHRLILRRCTKLQEIPFGMGEIPTLERIELVDCHPCAVDSAEQIQEEQQSMGNDYLKIHVRNHDMMR